MAAAGYQPVRMQASFRAACPFCIDLNSPRFREYDATEFS